MIPAIAYMIGAYIIVRMLEIISDDLVTKVAASICIVVTTIMLSLIYHAGVN